MNHWIVVASADHARMAVEGKFIQAGHGRHSAVAKLAPGDRLAIYSPRERMRAGEPVQAFTASGTVGPGEPQVIDRGEIGMHHRRPAHWNSKVRRAPVGPLVEQLDFLKGRKSWGLAFRRGLFSVSAKDFATIEAAMIHPGR